MRKNVFEYSVPAVASCSAGPVLRSLQLQASGALWGIFLFSSEPLQRFEWDAQNGNVVSVESEGMEKLLGEDCLGIWAGIRPSPTGDTVFTAWHRGSIPSFLNFFGTDLRKSDSAAINSLIRKDAGGSTIRHSIMELNSGEWLVRRGKEPGVLTDVAIIGDYVFGLTPRSVFREPYLKTEKREVLRSDLQDNLSLCRDASGTFWFQAQNGRLQRMALADLKPKMTPLKVEGQELGVSAASTVDGWMYVVVGEGKQLVRIRINPVTAEEELQVVTTFEGQADAVHVVDYEATGKLLVAESMPGQGSRVLAYELSKPEDPEMIDPAPTFSVLTTLDAGDRVSAIASNVQNLEDSTQRTLVWLGTSPVVGEQGTAKLKIISLVDV